MPMHHLFHSTLRAFLIAMAIATLGGDAPAQPIPEPVPAPRLISPAPTPAPVGAWRSYSSPGAFAPYPGMSGYSCPGYGYGALPPRACYGPSVSPLEFPHTGYGFGGYYPGFGQVWR
jgi:hypothetical protein